MSRTTLDIDNPILEEIKRLRDKEKKSMGRIVSDLLYDFWTYYQKTPKGMTVRGNLVPDAHIAAILLSNGVKEIVTNDSNFRRFSFLRVRNPFLSP
jgi:predicted nucleic acid-binding protein